MIKKIKTASLSIKTRTAPSDVAIVGFHGRFPKAENRRQLWEILSEGRNCIQEIPKERWQTAADGCAGKWGGFINDVDKFDPFLFRVSPKEADEMDPQQRLFLESVWTTMEDAGYGDHRSNPRNKIGLFVGSMWHEYSLFSHECGYIQNRYGGPGSLTWAIANRTSFAMNFTGPSIAFDTACSSSALAIHMACQSLLAKECEMAIAGGVNLNLHPSKFQYLAHENLLASEQSKFCFKPGSEGYVPSEGVGSLLLKPLTNAVADGDHIYAVIKGSGTNHNGGGMFFRVPDSEAQARLLHDVLKQSGLDPRTLSYIDMSAFGSELVDRTELSGLCKGFKKFTKEINYCALGSLKPNLGHLEAASGIAQTIKVLLQLQHRKLTPARFFDPTPDDLNLEKSPFYFQKELSDWRQPKLSVNGKMTTIPRRAGINSFGAGGTNVFILLEEYASSPLAVRRALSARSNSKKSRLIIVSAGQQKTLQEYLCRLRDFIKDPVNQNRLDLADIEYTLQVGREAMKERIAFIVHSLSELATKIDRYLTSGDNHNEIYRGAAEPNGGEVLAEEQIKKASLAELATTWTQGAAIVWKHRHQDNEHRRIPLPTYPFLQESYWIVPTIKMSSELSSEVCEVTFDGTDSINVIFHEHSPT